MVLLIRQMLMQRRSYLPKSTVQLLVMTRGDPGITHKKFLQDFIQSLLDRATIEVHGRNTRLSATKRRAAWHYATQKKRRMSHTQPKLPHYRLLGDPKEHIQTIADGHVQRTCIYCSYLKQKAKIDGGNPPPVKKVARKCSRCGDHLCQEHFDVFHS